MKGLLLEREEFKSYGFRSHGDTDTKKYGYKELGYSQY